jgi:hypothetical protein
MSAITQLFASVPVSDLEAGRITLAVAGSTGWSQSVNTTKESACSLAYCSTA